MRICCKVVVDFEGRGVSINGTENRDKKINSRKLLKVKACIYIAESPIIKSFVTYRPPTASLMAKAESVNKLTLFATEESESGNKPSIWHDSFDEKSFSPKQINISILKVNSNTPSVVKASTTQISLSEVNVDQLSTFQIGSKVSSSEIAINEPTSAKINSTQISIPKIDVDKISSGHIDRVYPGAMQVDSRQIDLHHA